MKEYRLTCFPPKKTKLTIGFLDENPYLEFHNQKMAGVFDAARKYDANIIRFTDYTDRDSTSHQYAFQAKMVLDHIEQYPLDGLIFIGWTKAVCDNFEDFKRRFARIPVISLGKVFESIPHVHFQGRKHIREIIIHLIRAHHLRRIAYIAPIRPDDRAQMYIDTMKEFGAYDPDLFVQIPEQEYGSLIGRGGRAIAILLDERKVKVEAIISVYDEETAELLKELKRRGLNVPRDIAVTSYEDGEIGKYSAPAVTTVHYPWYDLGFYGCERMIQLLTQGHIPLFTEVFGQVIYRNSCGCMSEAVTSAGCYDIRTQAGPLETITVSRKKAIITEMATMFPNAGLDFEILLDAFLRDYRQRSDNYFLPELAAQLKNFPYGFHNMKIETLISAFRRCLMPFLAHQEETILWAGDIFQQAQILVWETVPSIDGQAKVSVRTANQALRDISKILVADFSIRNLMGVLAENLPKLRIPSCYMFMFNSVFRFDDNHPDLLFEDCVLVFQFSNYTLLHSGENKPVNAKDFFAEILATNKKFKGFLAQLLHVGDDFMGFVLYEPGPMDEKIYQALSDHISTTLRGAILLKKLEFSYQRLAEQAHRAGMADISTEILHNMGNTLNSINTSVDLMKEALNYSAFADLSRANALLRDNLQDIENFIHFNPINNKLWKFYLKLGKSFRELKNQLLYHVNRLDLKIKSINEIITAQQNYAGTPEMTEELNISSVLEDALKLHAESFKNYHIRIVRDYQRIPKVLAQRNKLFHIFIHLINNAIEAMQNVSHGERLLKFSIYADSEGKYVRITDNGCGIPVNMLGKIFEYGYTTKKTGKGLGLHSCARYMAEMGGKLWAESNGPGTGAAFVAQFK
ncbi:MAG: substrate-binding domain-containing protein [Firmicutes bacterium]|nr:substrate-binding domain-containing protein [Bacillota bacterium]